MAPQGFHLPTLESSAGHTISLACGVGKVDEGPALTPFAGGGWWVPGEADPVLPSRGQTGLVGRGKERRWQIWTRSLRFLQANPLEVNYYSDVLKGKITVNIYRML